MRRQPARRAPRTPRLLPRYCPAFAVGHRLPHGPMRDQARYEASVDATGGVEVHERGWLASRFIVDTIIAKENRCPLCYPLGLYF